MDKFKQKIKEELGVIVGSITIYIIYYVITFFTNGIWITLLWNWITPAIMWCHPITYAQSLGLQFLIKLLAPKKYLQTIANMFNK